MNYEYKKILLGLSPQKRMILEKFIDNVLIDSVDKEDEILQLKKDKLIQEKYIENVNKDLARCKKTNKKLEEQIFFDSGLPNINELKKVWLNSNISEYSVYIYEIDDLKMINDILGEAETDKAIITVFKYLKRTVQRLLPKGSSLDLFKTGALFVFVVHSIKCEESKKLFRRLSDLSLYKDLNLSLEVTTEIKFNVGFCSYDKKYNFSSLKDMVLCTKQAVTEARKKRENKHCQFIFENCDDLEEYKLGSNFYQKLNQSINNGCNDFSIVYQPQICLKTKEIYGFEALLRLNLDNTSVSPFFFIKAAEDTLTINKLGEWLIEKVCIQIKEWKELGIFENKKVSVNLSGKQLLTNTLSEHITMITNRYDISIDEISFEITESVPLNKTIVENINILEDKGYLIAIDDYGTGCASLEHISEISYGVLKIDKRFLDDVRDDSEKHLNILKSIFEFSNGIDVAVVVEGVEEGRTKNRVIEIINEYQCIIQGYYFSKPLSSSAIVDWVRDFELNKNKYSEKFPCLDEV